MKPKKPITVRGAAKKSGIPRATISTAMQRTGLPADKAAAVIKAERESTKELRDRILKARAEIAEMESAKTKGELIPLSDVRAAQAAAVAIIQTDVMAIGEMMAVVLYGKDVIGIKEELDKHARRLITTWAQIPGIDGEPKGSQPTQPV